MAEHIIELCEEVIEAIANSRVSELRGLTETLYQEVEKLEPRDFMPGKRKDFSNLKTLIRNLSHNSIGTKFPVFIPCLKDMIALIQTSYGGKGSSGVVRTFPFVTDAALRTIIERDYAELKLLLQVKAWKSAVILAGSILEAILHDRLSSNPTRNTTAIASLKRSPKPLDDWGLQKLIDVAEDIGALPSSVAKTIDHVVRDFRNFVHPKKEIRSAHSCGEHQAKLAYHALEVVCDHCTTSP